MDADGLSALGFWIFIAALVVGGMWADARKKAERHETMRRIMEKTGTIDEAKLKELFKEEQPAGHKPGSGYRALRVLGTIVMFIGAGLLTFFLGFAALALMFAEDTGSMVPHDRAGMLAAFAACAGITMFGYGLFFSSRFAEPPPANRNDPPHAG